MFVDVVVVAAVGILNHRYHHFHHFSFSNKTKFLVTFTQTHANMFEFAIYYILIKTIDDFELELNAKCMERENKKRCIE